MNKNRRRIDIVRDMLSIMSVRVRKTRIMYQANLNYTLLEKYLKDLLESGLVAYDEDSYYLITKKGLEFLRFYDEYTKRCGLIEEQVDRSVRDRLLLERMCYSRETDCERRAQRKVLLPNPKQG